MIETLTESNIHNVHKQQQCNYDDQQLSKPFVDPLLFHRKNTKLNI